MAVVISLINTRNHKRRARRDTIYPPWMCRRVRYSAEFASADREEYNNSPQTPNNTTTTMMARHLPDEAESQVSMIICTLFSGRRIRRVTLNIIICIYQRVGTTRATRNTLRRGV